jgi:hypothetical protein
MRIDVDIDMVRGGDEQVSGVGNKGCDDRSMVNCHGSTKN